MRLTLEIHSYKVADNQYIAAYYLYIPKKNTAQTKKTKRKIKPQPKHSKIEILTIYSNVDDRAERAGGERNIDHASEMIRNETNESLVLIGVKYQLMRQVKTRLDYTGGGGPP